MSLSISLPIYRSDVEKRTYTVTIHFLFPIQNLSEGAQFSLRVKTSTLIGSGLRDTGGSMNFLFWKFFHRLS